MIKYYVDKIPTNDQLKTLYESVGWSTYLDKSFTLKTLLENSQHSITAWDDERLVGLVRVVGDGLFIAYIQDLLVHPSYHRQGIGTELMQRIYDEVSYASQVILTTDQTEKTQAFYQSVGMKDYASLDVIGFGIFKTNN